MAGSHHVSTLRDYLQVVRRRKWIIVSATLAVPLATLAISLQQTAEYQASAAVLLSQQDLGAQLTGTQSNDIDDPDHDETQAQLARVPNVALRALRIARVDLPADAFLARSSVTAGTTSHILTFDVTNHDPAVAARLATAYAHAYVAYALAIQTAPIAAARKEVDARIARTPRGSLYDTLVAKEQTLQEIQALKTSNASVIRDATGAVQTAPRTKRDVILGIVLGFALGIGLGFLREALDTRVRSAEAVSGRLGLPLLARLPEPPRKLRQDDRLTMLEEPTGVQAEAFRMLRTNLEFAALGKEARVVMVTSAIEQEGKTTTVANLAVALARAGQRVTLVDLDLRRPFLDRFFGLRDRPGVTQVALGHIALEDALVPVRFDDASPLLFEGRRPTVSANRNRDGNGNGALLHGSLELLVAGAIPPDPGEFVGTDRLSEILQDLRKRSDIVLVDAPPLFHVGDGLVLSSKVDAVIVITRMDVVRRPMIAELKRLLDTMPVLKLGFVITGAELEDGYGNGYGGYYQYHSYRQQPQGSVRT